MIILKSGVYMFEAIRFINHVFEACFTLYCENGTFNAEAVIDKLQLPQVTDKESDYWQKKNTTNSLNILENAKLLSGTIKPEYTENQRLLKEVRYGSITTIGKILPKIFRLAWIFIYINKQKLLALLGALSFLRLANNAYIGASLVSGWIEHLAALIILYIFYLILRKIID